MKHYIDEYKMDMVNVECKKDKSAVSLCGVIRARADLTKPQLLKENQPTCVY
jgi:hypothetical protein